VNFAPLAIVDTPFFGYIIATFLRVRQTYYTLVHLSNKEQGIETWLNFILDIKNQQISINIKLNQDVKKINESLLKYLRFTKSALSRSKLSIIVLEYDGVLAEGILTHLIMAIHLEILIRRLLLLSTLH
jgi:hypothetical protein